MNKSDSNFLFIKKNDISTNHQSCFENCGAAYRWGSNLESTRAATSHMTQPPAELHVTVCCQTYSQNNKTGEKKPLNSQNSQK